MSNEQRPSAPVEDGRSQWSPRTKSGQAWEGKASHTVEWIEEFQKTGISLSAVAAEMHAKGFCRAEQMPLVVDALVKNLGCAVIPPGCDIVIETREVQFKTRTNVLAIRKGDGPFEDVISFPREVWNKVCQVWVAHDSGLAATPTDHVVPAFVVLRGGPGCVPSLAEFIDMVGMPLDATRQIADSLEVSADAQLAPGVDLRYQVVPKERLRVLALQRDGRGWNRVFAAPF